MALTLIASLTPSLFYCRYLSEWSSIGECSVLLIY